MATLKGSSDNTVYEVDPRTGGIRVTYIGPDHSATDGPRPGATQESFPGSARYDALAKFVIRVIPEAAAPLRRFIGIRPASVPAPSKPPADSPPGSAPGASQSQGPTKPLPPAKRSEEAGKISGFISGPLTPFVLIAAAVGAVYLLRRK